MRRKKVIDMPETSSERSSWRLAPVTQLPPHLRTVPGLGDPSRIGAHHVMGSDGASSDPDRLHVILDHATMACGGCGRVFRVPRLDLRIHRPNDGTDSAEIECPFCKSSIRVSAIDDPSAPQAEAHWIATTQVSRPAGMTGPGWSQIKAGDIVLLEEPASRSAVHRVQRVESPVAASKGPTRWPLLVLAISAIVVGIAAIIGAATSETFLYLVVGAPLTLLGAIGLVLLLLKWKADRRLVVLAIVGSVALLAATLVPATGAVMRCRSLSPGADLSACDLAGRDLSGEDLNGVDLSDAVLTNVSFRDARLDDATLTDASLGGTDLTGAQLKSADLAGLDLTRAKVTGIEAPGVDLEGANLAGVDVTDADLSDADLTAADLSYATLDGSVLDGATLRTTDLTEASLAGSSLSGIAGEALDAGGAELPDAVLSNARLADADLGAAVLTGSDLGGADLTSATLKGADLSGSSMADATLRSADLRNVAGLTDGMLSDALNVPVSRLVPAVVAQELRFESPNQISEAVAGAILGKGVPGARSYVPSRAFHPIAAAPGSPGLARWFRNLQGIWTAPGLRFTELVATENRGRQLIETCLYNIHPIDRYRSTLRVGVYAAKTGAMVGERTFIGPPPRPCQFTESVSTYTLTGSGVNHNAAFGWLKSLVHPARGAPNEK